MNWLQKAWKWFDGKKTVIGSMMLIAADHIPRDKTAYIILSIGGQILAGTGVLHKAYKKEDLPAGLSKMKENIKSYWTQSTKDPE